jgi:short-chain fatty acids transporter
VTFSTVIVALFNWGLGLIFGAIFARKVGEFAKVKKIPLNYPLIGAAGYSGLMVWHGGISGSSLTKIAEKGHLKSLIGDSASPELIAMLPEKIPFSETVFSTSNLVCIALLLCILPATMYFIGKKSAPSELPAFETAKNETVPGQLVGAERLDYSPLFSKLIGGIIILYAVYLAISQSTSTFGFITPNFINLSLLGLGIFYHRNIFSFIEGLNKAIGGAAGILIQFPLYFGIMGIMKESGMISELSSFFVRISTADTFPIYTLFSAALVNIFVPSGGGQWAIQGPIIIQASHSIGVPFSKCVMALAYGDQLTNMLQPFWALPLLGITGLKAKEILPYTLLLMLVGGLIYLGVLVFF